MIQKKLQGIWRGYTQNNYLYYIINYSEIDFGSKSHYGR